MLRSAIKLVLTSFRGLFLFILSYIIPFLMMIIIIRTIGLNIYTFCLGYLFLGLIITIISLSNYHIKKKRVI